MRHFDWPEIRDAARDGAIITTYAAFIVGFAAFVSAIVILSH